MNLPTTRPDVIEGELVGGPPMTRDQLLASLLAGREDDGAVRFEDGSYIDFSCPLYDDDYETVTGRSVEFGDEDGEAVGIPMTWARLERLQRALTLLLLERPTA